MRILKMIALCVMLVLALTACVGTPPLTADMTDIDTSKGAVVLLVMEFENAYKPDFPADAMGLVHTPASPDRALLYITSAKVTENKPSIAYFNLQLQPGKYEIEQLLGMIVPSGLGANYHFTISMPYTVLDAQKSPYQYLGHLRLKNVERTSFDEQRSGMIIPLLQQHAAGFTGGTLKIEASDEFSRDIALFTTEYPFLKEKSITKIVPKALYMQGPSTGDEGKIAIPFLHR